MSSVSPFDFPVFDADNHLYETTDALTKYLPPSTRGPSTTWRSTGAPRSSSAARSATTSQPDLRPGGSARCPGGVLQGSATPRASPTVRSSARASTARRPSARRAAGSAHGRTGPGLRHHAAHPGQPDRGADARRPRSVPAAIHGLNMWMPEAWPYIYEGPDLLDPDHHSRPGRQRHGRARVRHRPRARAVLMRPAPAWGYRGPGRSACRSSTRTGSGCEEAGILVVFHASDSGYVRYANEWEGSASKSRRSPLPTRSAPRCQHPPRHPGRGHLAHRHGAFWRFPKLRIALIENGAGWVPGLLEHLDHV